MTKKSDERLDAGASVSYHHQNQEQPKMNTTNLPESNHSTPVTSSPVTNIPERNPLYYVTAGQAVTAANMRASNRAPRNNKYLNRYKKTYSKKLPPDLNVTFSDWFYQNMKSTKRTQSTQNNLYEEPNQDLLELTDEENNFNDFKLLTQDLNDNKIEPIKKIYNYKISIKEKLNKANIIGESSISKNNPSADSSNLSKQGLPKPPLNELTLTIETSITTIDCRPMLKKKLKVDKILGSELGNKQNKKGNLSLIAPEEDCDDSEREENIEIDCD